MGGVAVRAWFFSVVEEAVGVEGADSEVDADVLVMQDEENKGVCVDAVVVQGLETARED